MTYRTPDITPDGTSDRTSDGEEEEYSPPCRAAGRYVTSCPMCGRSVQLKTLKYTHQCGRSFDVAKRAAEQQKSAIEALKTRTAQEMEQRLGQGMEHRTERTATTVPDKRARYAQLLNF